MSARLRRQCVGKIAHETKQAALSHVFSLVRGGARKGRVSAYKCKVCGKWHVGNAAPPIHNRR